MGIVLPTFLSIMRAQDNWSVSYAKIWGSYSLGCRLCFWLLERFFEITGAFSLLDMQEEQQRNDKVQG